MSMLGVISSYPQLIQHEDEIAKNAYSVTAWTNYLDDVDQVLDAKKKKKSHDKDTICKVRDFVGRRAVKHLPRSYKIWRLHWDFATKHQVGNAVDLFESALATLSKFPRVWIEYIHYAHAHHKEDPTALRRLANRALEALPPTQHDKIWAVLLEYYKTMSDDIPKETKVSMLRRYIQFDPESKREIADFFANQLDKWGEAALLYKALLEVPRTTPSERQDLWISLAGICTKHPVETIGLDWNAIVRSVVKNKKFLPDQLEGVLWNQLADSWIRRGEFQLARSVYEEAIETVSSVRDFTILMDAYLQFEESLLEEIIQNHDDDDEAMDEAKDEAADGAGDCDWDILLGDNTVAQSDSTPKATYTMSDLELALTRAENLTGRRPILLNRVMLRQNPNDVGEWLNRCKLYLKNKQPEMAAAALEEGLRTVYARKAIGGTSSQMVTELAKVYENKCKSPDKARDLFDRICNQNTYEFKHADDLADCHAAFVEFELRHENWDAALSVVRKSVVVQKGESKIVRGIARSLRLWDLLLDLEESLGTVQTTKDTYNQAIDQKVATPLHILNFATYLKEKKYFEESFTAYERGIELFEFPAVKVIWKAYLEAFLDRYQDTRVERTRDLFQRCVDAAPPEDLSEFYMMFADFEEKCGTPRRALKVYKDLCKRVPTKDKFTAYQLFVAKTTQTLGLPATREIYQEAIEALPEAQAAQTCLDFAKMETSLTEMDRARGIYAYGAQMADPRMNPKYWSTWKDFEVTHGNEETFREMLRIKRSVEAAFSTVNYNAAEMSSTSDKVTNLSNDEAMRMIASQEGIDVKNRGGEGGQTFVRASKRPASKANLEDVEERVAKLRKAVADPAAGGDGDDDAEIDLEDLLGGEDEDGDDDGDGDAGEGGDDAKAGDDENDDEKPKPSGGGRAKTKGVKTKAVPAAVFGGLAK